MIKEQIIAGEKPSKVLGRLLDQGYFTSKAHLAVAFAGEFDEHPVAILQSILLWNRQQESNKFCCGVSDEVLDKSVYRYLRNVEKLHTPLKEKVVNQPKQILKS